MKRFTLGQLILCCGLCVAATVGLGLSMKITGWHHALAGAVKESPKEVTRDLNHYLNECNTFYQNVTEHCLQNKRHEDQAKILEAYRKDPSAFVQKYINYDRIYLFDAVIDAGNMVRVGTFGDGGKWVSDPQALNPGAVVYSFGLGEEISFDTEMAGLYGCEVHGFDPAPSVQKAFSSCPPKQPVGKGTFWYHALGLGPTSLESEKADDLVLEGCKCRVKRFIEIAAELGHAHVDILKIDIEGGEMAAMTEILSSGTLAKLSVKQLLVEFHLWDDDHFSAFANIIDQLRRQGYQIFRKEFNPWNARCAEFAFLGPQ